MTTPDPRFLEQGAYAHLGEERFQEAYKSFTVAAQGYKKEGNHKQSALCFAAAASCWALKSGERTFSHAAASYEAAAAQAEACGDLEYASLLYRYAAIQYEKDMESFNFSECFYKSKESYRKFLTLRLFRPCAIHPITESREARGFRGVVGRFFAWVALTFSYLVWGHGERPGRTFLFGIFLIMISALFYAHGYLVSRGEMFRPGLLEALYFSIITFTTVGYGDIAPVGLSRLVVVIELVFGIFVIPLFVVGLSRKYLRI